ncbi:hypothetical protein A1F99_142660, partial [Pyrenophora tritici-repentis]
GGVVSARRRGRSPGVVPRADPAGRRGQALYRTLALANLADAPKFRRLGVEPVGDDLWERYVRA